MTQNENATNQPKLEILNHPQAEAVMMNVDAKEWHARVNELIDAGTTFVTFRGAGTVNGIDPLAAEAAAAIVADKLSELIESGEPVALVYDGDDDNRDLPDIGSIFGMVADTYKDAPNVLALTGQRQDWYYPKEAGAKLESATGTLYETYVFPTNMLGAHKELTQSEKIVSSARHRQLVIGPAGPIATEQLKDLSDKTVSRPVELGPISVDVIETRNNPMRDATLKEMLESGDPAKQAKAKSQIEQRQAYPRGALFTNDGQFKPTAEKYPGLEFTVESLADFDSRTLEQRLVTVSQLGNTIVKSAQ